MFAATDARRSVVACLSICWNKENLDLTKSLGVFCFELVFAIFQLVVSMLLIFSKEWVCYYLIVARFLGTFCC